MDFRVFLESTSVLLDFPSTRQSKEFTCGAAAMQMVLAYYGKDFNEQEMTKKLGTNPKEGTACDRMAEYARQLGLKASVETMDVDAVKQAISKKHPVILAIQAWSEQKQKNYKGFASGHFVVAIGFDSSGLYFADPALYNKGFLSVEELEKRWHIKENDKEYQNLAVLIQGKPQFNAKEAERIK